MTVAAPAAPPTINASQALAVADADAWANCGDMSDCYIRVQKFSEGWYISYELIDKTLNGGGPHYMIDAHTGAILRKKYYQ